MQTSDSIPERHLGRAARRSFVFCLGLWLVLYCDRVFALGLFRFGVSPRELEGLVGVLTAPLIHGSALHLMANTPPLLLIGAALLYGYPRAARIALPAIWLLSGLGVWLFARPSLHIGASGLAHGILAFVLVAGLVRRDRASMGLAMAVAFLYGSMLWGVLPLDPEISFESHLAGTIVGGVCGALLVRLDPWPRRVYAFEQQGEEEDDPVIGDLWRETNEDDGPGWN
mgnify:CR=1 FL=1